MDRDFAAQDRRTFLKAAVSAAAWTQPIVRAAVPEELSSTVSLFDGKTLGGWIQIENSWTSFGSSDLLDLGALAKRIVEKSDNVAAYVNAQTDDSLRARLTAYSPSEAPTNVKATASDLAKALTKLISDGSLYDSGVFQNVPLGLSARRMLQENPQGANLVRLNRMLLEDAFPGELAKSPATGWVVKDGAMASTGAGRGVI